MSLVMNQTQIDNQFNLVQTHFTFNPTIISNLSNYFESLSFQAKIWTSKLSFLYTSLQKTKLTNKFCLQELTYEKNASSI